MKRMTILLCGALLAALLLPAKASDTLLDEAPLEEAPQEGVLRLHILANSDSAWDQALKLQVRDALLPLFEAAASYDDARAFVLSHGAALLQLCEGTLNAAGAPYGAQLLLGVSAFPDRTYGAVRFPAGAYDALQIVLGAGAGHNWWCVLFPPLCIVVPERGEGAEPVFQSVPVVFESSLLRLVRRCLHRG